jgi:ankyrin repeat protein
MSHRFQWVFCQLETLRHAVQPDIREILKALPRTLDETYERILKSINEKNRKHARHLLHCLAVSARPLRVEELAEILTFDFDGAQGGIPKFYSGRRPKDKEEAVLSICSSLISIVDNGDSRMVQFSHLSVKEFLTSNHFASATGDLPLYHILPGPAHTTLAQVCLGLLLNLDGRNYYENVRVSPLAEYAARHWVVHAQFEGVTSHVLESMKTLFDPDKPHFAAWICLFDADAEFGGRLSSETPSPLYYSAFHGFHDLVRYLAIKHPQDVNAFGGSYEFPLFAALRRNHFKVAETLLEHGGNVDVRGKREQTTLHKTIYWHDKLAIEVVQFLLEHGADLNAQRNDLWTPLHLAAYNGNLAVARILLDHGADVNLRNDDDQAPLHLLSGQETFQDEKDVSDIARLLLERGANVNEKDQDNATPLHLASYNKRPKIAQVLFDHGANADAGKCQGETSMQMILGDILGDGEDSKHHHSQSSKPPLCVLIPPPPSTAPRGRLRSSSEHELSPVRHVAPGASQPIIPIASTAQQTTMSAYHDAEEFQGDTPLQIVLTGLINDSDGENHSQSSPTPPFRTPLYTPPPTATDGHLGSFNERELSPAVPHVAPKATQPIITITSAAQQATISAYHDAEEFKGDTPLQIALMGLFNDSGGENSSQSSPTPPFRTPLHTPSPTATRGRLCSSSELEPSPAVPHATSKATHPIITITRTAPEATTGASAHLPSVSLGGAPAPATSGRTQFPLDPLTLSLSHPYPGLQSAL